LNFKTKLLQNFRQENGEREMMKRVEVIVGKKLNLDLKAQKMKLILLIEKMLN